MCVSQEGVHMCTHHVLISKEINRVEFPRVGVTVHSKLSDVGAGNQVGPPSRAGTYYYFEDKMGVLGLCWVYVCEGGRAVLKSFYFRH